MSGHCWLLPSGSFILALFGGVRVHDVCPETLQGTGEGEVLSKVHLVAERGGVLGLDPSVAQQRLEDHLWRTRAKTPEQNAREGYK